MLVDTHTTVQIDTAYHSIRDATSRRRAVEEDGLRIVDPDGVLRGFVQHLVHWIEAREEARLAGPSHFVRDTGKAIFSAHDAVVERIEVELNEISYRCFGDLRPHLMIQQSDLNSVRLWFRDDTGT